jgi:ABC-2 type transport system permease protein
MNRTRVAAISRKEFLQIRRDARSLYLAFVLPLVLLVLFGYAISFDIRDIRMAVLDESGTARSRALVDAFRSSGYFTVTRNLERLGDADGILDRGAAKLVLVIPRSFADDLAAGRPAAVQALLDGADANTATIAQNYAQAIVNAQRASYSTLVPSR